MPSMSTLEREARVAELHLLRDRLGRFTVSAVQQHIEDRLAALQPARYRYWVVYEGRHVPLVDACAAAGKNYEVVRRRIKACGSAQRAFDLDRAPGRPQGSASLHLPLKTDRVA